MEITLIIYYFLTMLSLTFAGRENIMNQMRRESWISKEDFSTVVKLSYPYSECCNIYLSDSIHDIEVIFNQFIHIYPYEYLAKVRTYACQGYFLVAPSDEEIVKAMKKVPVTISTTEILIVVDEYLNNNANIFNVSLYGNSNANLITRSGIWKLSENYLIPRKFEKVKRYEDLKHQTDHVNLRGRELQVSTFYHPPTSYLNTTVKKVINGEEVEVFLTNNETEFDGIEIKLFLLVAEKLNFTWTLRKPSGLYRYGRRYNETAWEGGVIQLLLQKKIDMAFAGIWMTHNQSTFANLTESWSQVLISFLVPRPKPTTSFWALTRPFSVGVWVVLVITLLVHSLYLCGRAWIDKNFPKRFRHFLISLTELTGRMLGTWNPRNVANVQFQMLLWQCIGLVIVTAYSSSLAARLSNSEYEPRIDTVQQFLEAGLVWGRTGAIPPFGEYFDLNDKYASRLPERYIHINSSEDTHEYVAKGKYAILGRLMNSKFFPEDSVHDHDLKNYRVMKEPVGKYYTCFAVQPWLLQPVNQVMLALRESGIAYYHLRDVLWRRTNFDLREVLVEYDVFDNKARELTLMPLGAGFSTLIIGLLISSLVFYLELKYVSGSRSIRDVIRDIERRRKLYEFLKYKRKSNMSKLYQENIREKVDIWKNKCILNRVTH